MLRDPVSESIAWKTINYSIQHHFLSFDVISYLVNKIFCMKATKKHHTGRFVFFSGTTNHAHLIWGS